MEVVLVKREQIHFHLAAYNNTRLKRIAMNRYLTTSVCQDGIRGDTPRLQASTIAINYTPCKTGIFNRGSEPATGCQPRGELQVAECFDLDDEHECRLHNDRKKENKINSLTGCGLRDNLEYGLNVFSRWFQGPLSGFSEVAVDDPVAQKERMIGWCCIHGGWALGTQA
ncbi:hypothetical protein NEOLEDRAFT_1145375 [Neolentinus lepideus HHB14362 ss-1]|uniref:Uncharacterized protein n=1 Tax=Neolentinus lepideus HHB14362 ss-1 TaxID=1314782 RepID=A0A165V2W1_9AGAM|nr:hypothetical protein NEOLEDRAFT_1145375 [Neolentinus lepideus HHB14362 ss-1]